MNKKILLILPVVMLLVACNNGGGDDPDPDPNKYTVTFDSDGGTSIPAQEVEENKCASKPTDPTKETTAEFTFDFKEWQLDGATYDFNTPVTKDITLKAKWTQTKQTYSIIFDSDGGTDVPSQTKEYGDEFTKPANPTKQTDIYNYEFDDWYQVIEGKIQEDPIVFPITVTEDITVKAKWKNETKRHYKANVDTGNIDHIKFTDKDGKELKDTDVVAGDPFVFKMEAIAPGSKMNEGGNKLPSQLSIFVGESTIELEKDYYTIEADTTGLNEDEPLVKAKVTIKGEKVTGNLKIGGKAVPEEYYAVDASKCYGVSAKVESDKAPYFYTTEDGKVTFSQQGTYELPAAENIFVQFDDNDWVNPSKGSEWCTYNANTLTLNKDKAKNNVKIIARSPQYALLEKAEWATINNISSNGYAPYFFIIGEEKTVEVNDLDHKVRIIGFNHDDLADGSRKAGITFEFANVITDSNGAVTTYWNSKRTNSDFPNSALHMLLNTNSDCIFTRLPEDLQGVIKEVNKKVGRGASYSTETPYQTKLFPLAHDEIVVHESYVPDGEGTEYQYYIDHSKQEDRIKNIVDGDAEHYWLRSPGTDNLIFAWRVYDTGAVSAVNISTYACAVAPAFCI